MSQLFTNKPFIKDNNTNKYIINFSRSDCITKKINKRINKDKNKIQQRRKKIKDNNKKRQQERIRKH